MAQGGLEVLEKDIERYLRDEVKALGGLCLKLVCPGFTGVPDRLILLPGGVVAFAELKRPGQKERQRQAFVQHRLRRMGFTVFGAVDSRAKANGVVSWCAERMTGGDYE